MRLHLLRKFAALIVIVLTAGTFVATPAASAQAPTRDFGAESAFLGSINAQRAAGGLAPLTMNGSMTAAADGWARAMAEGSFLAHAGDIVSGTPAGWSKVGENVGRGQSVSSLTTAFMNSASHRANIMDPTFTHIGIAVYVHPTDGRIYTTHRFAALGGAAPAAAPAAPTATPTIAPPPVQPTPEPTATIAPPPPPVQPTPEPTATPVPPTPVPPTPEPTATAVEPTPVPPTPEPTATAAPATPEVTVPEEGFGTPPELLAFVDEDAAAEAKLASKLAKLFA